MKRANRLISLLLCALLLTAAFAACAENAPASSSPADTAPASTTASSTGTTPAEDPLKGELSMLMWQPDAPEIVEAWASTFMEKHPGVKVDLQMMTGSGLAENLQPRIAANTLPDVLSTNVSELCTDIADKGMLADVSDTKSWNEMIEGMKTAWTSPEGVKFGISGGVASSLIYYNKDLMKQAGVADLPKNWDEFLAVCEQLKTAGITPLAWFGGFPNLLSHGPLSWGMANEIIRDIPDYPAMSKSEKYDYAGWDKIYEKMVLLGEKGYFQEGFLGSDMNQTQQVFLDGEAAMIIDGTWNSALFFDAPGLDVDCLIPPWNAAGQDFVAVLGSEAGWSIAAGGNETLSKALLDHMCYDNFDVYQHKRKGISPFKPNSKYLLDARMGIYIESLSGASISVGLASHVMPPAVFAEAMKLCQEMYTGKTPAEVPAQLAKLQSEYIDQKTK